MLDNILGQELFFYGVDFNSFKLNSTVYEAIEDEFDGYRSYLSSIEINNFQDLIFFSKPLALVKVFKYDDIDFEGYKLEDVSDGHVWLTIGTDMIDHYYPCFIFLYNPKYND